MRQSKVKYERLPPKVQASDGYDRITLKSYDTAAGVSGIQFEHRNTSGYRGSLILSHEDALLFADAIREFTRTVQELNR